MIQFTHSPTSETAIEIMDELGCKSISKLVYFLSFQHSENRNTEWFSEISEGKITIYAHNGDNTNKVYAQIIADTSGADTMDRIRKAIHFTQHSLPEPTTLRLATVIALLFNVSIEQIGMLILSKGILNTARDANATRIPITV